MWRLRQIEGRRCPIKGSLSCFPQIMVMVLSDAPNSVIQILSSSPLDSIFFRHFFSDPVRDPTLKVNFPTLVNRSTPPTESATRSASPLQ